MSAIDLHDWIVSPRRRAAQRVVAVAAPLALAAALIAWRVAGSLAAVLVAILAIAGTIAAAALAIRPYTRAWLIRGLDARRADLEDSADLLAAPDAALTSLARLQRDRLRARLAEAPAPDLRAPWPWRAIGIAWLVAAGAAATLLWHPAPPAATLAPSTEGLPAAPGVPRLVAQRLRVVPPAYTGLPARDLATLDARAPEGSQITWTLRFAPAPESASLTLADGGTRPLAATGSTWRGAMTLTRSVLYRVVPRGTDRMPPLHRLDAVPDRPPQVSTRQRTLVLVVPGQRAWAPAFEATDDYGVAARGELRITLAQGEGENFTFGERTVGVVGDGPPRARRFVARLDLAALGFTGVGDLIAQLTVADARGQRTRGASLILRRPAPVAENGAGLEGAVKKALPAYFRSQRQIIIDAETLLRERRGLAPDRFTARSDGIGVDQRMLRMRYGQFLGEESEGPSVALPTSDEEKPDDHDHDHPPPATTPLGSGEDVLAEYGHTHDEPEAATLLDPDTRATLRQALDQMWQSELHLRQGDPAGALPFANRALVFIKRVQQATRIFLQRTGSAEPAIDESRRLTGKREGIAGAAVPLATAAQVAAEPAATWRALAEPGAVPLGALERWLAGAAVPDRLALAAAIDALRQRPGCAACRTRLRALLWAALPRPVARVTRRAAPDAAARRYLDAAAR